MFLFLDQKRKRYLNVTSSFIKCEPFVPWWKPLTPASMTYLRMTEKGRCASSLRLFMACAGIMALSNDEEPVVPEPNIMSPPPPALADDDEDATPPPALSIRARMRSNMCESRV